MKFVKYLTAAMCISAIMCSCNKKEEGTIEPDPKPVVERILEDFEDGGILTWTASGGGTAEVVANPFKTGINTSANVCKVVNSGAKWEFLWSTGFGATEDGSFDFLNFSEEGYIVKVKTYSPRAGVPVYLKLEGKDVDAIEISTVATSVANAWEELEFDYEPYSPDDSAYKNFVILFDAGVEGNTDTFYFDDVRLVIE